MFKIPHDYKKRESPSFAVHLTMCLCVQVFTFTWREDIRPGDPQHTKKFCFDAISHTSPVTLYDCHSMKGNQLWKYRQVRQGVGGTGKPAQFKKNKCNASFLLPRAPPSRVCSTDLPCPTLQSSRESRNSTVYLKSLES